MPKDVSNRPNQADHNLVNHFPNWQNIVLDSITDIVGIADKNGNTIYISPSVEKILGYKPEDLIGTSGFEITHPDDLQSVTEAIKKLKNKKEITFEYRCKNNLDSYIWLEISFKLVWDKSSKSDYMVFVARVIENRKKLEAELLETANELAKTNKLKDKLFSLIAHDLKNPIYSIITLTEFTRKQLPKLSMDAFPDFVLHVNESAKTAYTLLENLLQWAKLQTEVVPYHPEQIKLDRVIKDSMDIILLQAALKYIKVVNNIPASLYIYADGKMLDTIIRNLLTNAVNFTQEHGTVTIKAEKTSTDVIVSIQDTGIGLTREQLKFLFSPDSRKKINSMPTSQGSGLGLILSKELINIHGGKIVVVSKLGKGTTFTLSFPHKDTK